MRIRAWSRSSTLSFVLAVVVGIVTVSVVPANAASTLVDCANGGDLAAAVIAAAPGDTLVINGTCIGNYVIDKNLTLSGLTGAALDGGGQGRVVDVESGKVKIRGLVLKNGTSGLLNDGGDIFNAGNLTVTDSSVTASFASNFGAGVYNAGTLTLSNSTVSGAFTLNTGGGIFNAGTLTLSGATVSGNIANNVGGGVYNTGTLTLSGATISGNAAVHLGGGIFNAGTLKVSNSTLIGNSSANGGGMYNAASSILTLSSSTVSGNSVTEDGAGIKNLGTLNMSSSTLSGNESSGFGAGINSEGQLTVSSSTVSSNTAVANGGGILSTGTALVGSSIVAGNSAAAASDCLNITSNGYNLIGDADGCAYSAGTGDQVGSTSGSGAIDPMLGLLASNGGSTKTQALAPGGPAVDVIPIGTLGSYDASTPLCPASGATDQRGIDRLQGVACDVGAYELKTPWIAAVTIDAGQSGSTPSVWGTITCNLGASFAVSITLSQGKKKALGTSAPGDCNGLTPVFWVAAVSPGTFANGIAKVAYTASTGNTTKKGKTSTQLGTCPPPGFRRCISG